MEGEGKHTAPFFIVGAHRSGTTMLRCMLCATGEVFIPPESDFIPRFFPRAHANLTPRHAQRVLHALTTEHRYRLFVRDWKPAPPQASDLFDPQPGVFLDHLYRHYAAGHGATRWGDKTPIYASYLPLLAALFPTARFIHIIRDGRDVAMSTVEHWGGKEWHTDLHTAIRTWGRRVRDAQRDGGRLGDRYTQVHYEQLVTHPRSELQRLCDFLNLPFHPCMTEPARAAATMFEKNDPFQSRLHQPVSDDRCQRWRREMSPAHQRLCEATEGKLLVELGYPRVWPNSPRPAAESLRQLAMELKYTLVRSLRQSLTAAHFLPPA